MLRMEYNFYEDRRFGKGRPITKGGSLLERSPITKGGSLLERSLPIATLPDTAYHTQDPFVVPSCRQSHLNLRVNKLRASIPSCLKIGQLNLFLRRAEICSLMEFTWR
jgi:hypothetical protein